MVQPKKLVELGRVVHITTGPCAGEIGAIVDIIDAKRILVDGPRITRQEIKLKNMFLTRIMLKYNDVLSHKALIELWERNLVDMRYKRTVHAQRLQKLEKRAACTDFEYFKVRCAARSANKIKENALKNLHAKHPRALAKMERSRRINMGVKLGYRTVKTLTDEEKAVKAAREKIIRANMKTKSIEYKKAKKEKRAKIAEARKARNALKKEKREKENKTGADGEPPCPVELGKPGKSKELKPKKRSPKTPKPPRMSSVRLFRKQRDDARKAAADFRKTHTKELQENRAARKAAVAAGTKPPRLLKAKTIKPKRSTVRKAIKKAQDAKQAAAIAE